MQTAKAGSPAPAPLDSTAWRAIAGLGITQIIGWGSTYYLLTILGRPIAESLAISPTLAFSGMSILMVLGAIIGPFSGRFMDMNGAKPAMAGGSVLAAIGLALLSLAQGPVSFVLAWIVIGATSPLILYPAAFTALTQVTPTNARRAITMLTLPGGLASTVFWPLTTALAGVYDWRSICLIYAALHLLVCLPLHLAVLPQFDGPQDRKDIGAAQGSEGLPQEARPRAFVLFAIMLALNSMLVTGVLNQFMAFLLDLGQTQQNAVMLGIFFGFAQLSARLTEMVTGQRFDALSVGVAVCVGYALSLAGLVLAGASPVSGMLFAILFGASNGILTIVRGALVLHLFGVTGFGEKLGTLTVAQGLAGASAPIILSTILTAFGGTAAAAFCFAIATLALVAMLALFRHATVTMNRNRSSHD